MGELRGNNSIRFIEGEGVFHLSRPGQTPFKQVKRVAYSGFLDKGHSKVRTAYQPSRPNN
jgi:hypothetical protein